MIHTFNSEVALKTSVDEAIIFSYLSFWINENKKKDVNYHDGCYWTFKPASVMAKNFLYYSESKISRLLRSLENKGLIKSNNFNKSKYNKTKWYALTSEGEKLNNTSKKHDTKENKRRFKSENSELKNEAMNESFTTFEHSNLKDPSCNSIESETLIQSLETDSSIILNDIIKTCPLNFSHISNHCEKCWKINKCILPVEVSPIYLDDDKKLMPDCAKMFLDYELKVNKHYDMSERIKNGVSSPLENEYLQFVDFDGEV